MNKNKGQQIFVISSYIWYLALTMESNCLCSGVVFLYTIMKPFHMKYHFQECLYYTRLNFILLEIPILWYELLDMFTIFMAYYQTESVVAVLRIYFKRSKIDAKLNEPSHLSLWNPYLIITLIIGIIMGSNSLKLKWWIDFKYIDIN